MTDRYCVYDLIEDGVVVYVGLSLNPARRLRDHKRSGDGPRGLRPQYRVSRIAGSVEEEPDAA